MIFDAVREQKLNPYLLEHMNVGEHRSSTSSNRSLSLAKAFVHNNCLMGTICVDFSRQGRGLWVALVPRRILQ